ncbi:MAG: type II toxin-antitoxin system HicA family toxin [Crocosphaera sp.]
MSQRSPRLTAREVIKQLKKYGFVEVSQTGSHLKLFNPETQKTAIVPIHKGKMIPLGTIS